METFVIAVRSGYTGQNYASMRVLGLSSYYWSATSSPNLANQVARLAGYDFYFIASGIRPSNGPDDRWYAFPIRCLAY